MGLVQQEIKELRQMNRQYVQGKVSDEEVDTRTKIYNQTIKRMRLMSQMLALDAKYNGRVSRRIAATNLIGNREAIEVDTPPGDEKIGCPHKEKLITRDVCLDYSGSHMEACAGCEHKKVTQDVLLGEI